MDVCDNPHDQSGNSCNFSSLEDVDLLGLFATGNIIIPNSMPQKVINEPYAYTDDWSDSEVEVNSVKYGTKLFAPTGIFDQRPFEMPEDNGSEDIHAVMVSFGKGPCSGFDGDATCLEPTADDIREFRTGLYAMPRTSNMRPNGTPFSLTGGVWTDVGNDSGTIRIVGALIQNIPGRVGYDYSGSAGWANSTCTEGGGDGNCNFIGHRMELFYDDRLNYTAPVTPRAVGTNQYLPYGRASYDILSWEEMRNRDIDTEMTQNLW